jgi:hypothetical protein
MSFDAWRSRSASDNFDRNHPRQQRLLVMALVSLIDIWLPPIFSAPAYRERACRRRKLDSVD